jgi:hypothetical protein
MRDFVATRSRVVGIDFRLGSKIDLRRSKPFGQLAPMLPRLMVRSSKFTCGKC